MSEIRSTEERIAELDKKMEQIKAQKKAILQREKEIQRKARTRRLIEVGGAVESVLGHPIEKEDIHILIDGGTAETYRNYLKTQEICHYSHQKTLQNNLAKRVSIIN